MIVRNVLLWLIGLTIPLLAGCNPQVKPDTVYQTLEVTKTVRQPCIDRADVPPEPAYPLDDPGIKSKPEGEQGVAALQENEMRRERLRILEPLVKNCLK